jgi:ABC-type tungstate transport system permease subunit
LLVHDKAGEESFVADGYGVDRRDVMYNDFVIVGPRFDPADIRGMKDAREAFARIAAIGALFASRGDSGGTYRMELRIWKLAGVEPGARAGIAIWTKALDTLSILRRQSTPMPSLIELRGQTLKTGRT